MNSIEVNLDRSDANCLIKNKELIEDTQFEQLLSASYDLASDSVVANDITLIMTYPVEDEKDLIEVSKRTDDWSGVFVSMRQQMLGMDD
ncbi:hypothetical protein [Vibrio owensii]|uniref:hypothetical protein n=1 Tax=Vibrio harveyi group TaxID=717610 RepID=UPI003CC6C21C